LVALLREIAEQTWAVLERPRAETAQGAAQDTFRRAPQPEIMRAVPLIDKPVGHAALLDEFARQLTPAG
jgi:hypothetical protein